MGQYLGEGGRPTRGDTLVVTTTTGRNVRAPMDSTYNELAALINDLLVRVSAAETALQSVLIELPAEQRASTAKRLRSISALTMQGMESHMTYETDDRMSLAFAMDRAAAGDAPKR